MKKLLWLLLLVASPAFAQYDLYQNCQLQTATGQAVAGAQVYFLTQPANTVALTPQAQVYSSLTGGPVTQPLTTNGFGECSAYLAPGIYTVVYISPFTGELVYIDQLVGGGGGGGGTCGHDFIPCLNTPNTWLTGIQTFLSSGINNVPIVVQGSAGGTVTPAFVQGSAAQVSGPFFGCAFTLNGVVAGDAIVATAWTSRDGGPATISDDKGDTYTQAGFDDVGTGGGVTVNVAPNVAGGNTTITMDNTGEVSGCMVSEYSGVASTNPIDGIAFAGGSAPSSLAIGPITTTNPTDIVISSITNENTIEVATQPAGYTLDYASNEAPTGGAWDYISSLIVNSAGSQTGTWTTLGGHNTWGFTMALKAGGSGLYQNADLVQFNDSAGTKHAAINSLGQFVLPAYIGGAFNVPGGPALAYNSTSNCPEFYDPSSSSWSTLCGTGVSSINSTAGPFTFNFSSGAGSCTGTTCTFTGSGGGSAFDAITSGTNTTAAMVVGSGASLAPTGSGTINANEVNGATVPASNLFAGINSGSQFVAATTANLTTFLSALTGCANPAFAYVPADGQCETLTGSGVTSINSSSGAFTFSFSSGAGSCTGTTCTFTGAGSGGGSVTNFIASSWPSWLTPSVATSTTTPTLSVAASAIPNVALANDSVTIGSTSVALGATAATLAGVTLTSPTLTAPALGTPISGVMTNVTGLPLTTGVTGILPIANGGTATATPALIAGTNITITGSWPDQTIFATTGFPITLGSTSIAALSTTASVAGLTVDGVSPTTFGFVDPTSSIQTQLNAKAAKGANSDITSLTGLTTPLSKAQGGTGTASPGLVAGSNITITGSWPNQTVASSGGGSMTWPATAGIALYSGASSWLTSLTAPSGAIVGTTDAQTLTNKSIAGSEINSGTIAPAFGGTGGDGSGYAIGNGTSPFTYSTTIPGTAITGNISGNAGTATALASAPTTCVSANEFSQGIGANGNSDCNPHLTDSGGSLAYNPGSGSTIFGSGTASNTDGIGELSFSGTTTESYTWVNTYTSHPECTVTPQADPGSGVRYYVTYTGTASFTINFTTAFTGSVSYLCSARN